MHKNPRKIPVSLTLLIIMILIMTTLISGLDSRILLSPSKALALGDQVYWGAYMDGDQYGYGDAPWDTRTIDTFEQHAGKPVSIIHWGQFWHWGSQSGYPGIGDGFFQKFDTNLYERVRQHGSIPMINWNSWDNGAGGSSNQPTYQLSDIINGTYDAYIRQWARDAAAWGKPFFLRFDHEMNGTWYPWSEQANGNQTGQYVQMWRHVHDLFQAEGASNVTWVWSVNTEYPGSGDLSGLYPGDAYVDWVAIDGYNWGTNPAKPDAWKSFSQVFSQTYNRLGQIAPNKPVMLSEFASTEFGGSKASWITDALSVQLPQNFTRVKAIVWFNWNVYEGSGQMDWVIESSSTAKNAFTSGIGSSYYAGNGFAALNTSPIQPLTTIPRATITSTYLPVVTATATFTPLAPPPPISTSQPGSNLVLNPSFETTGSAWLAPWALVTGSGAAGSVAQDGTTKSDGAYSARLSITTSAPSAPWGVQLNQHNLSLGSGSSVSGSFRAKASAPRDIMVVVQLGASPYTEYFRRTYTLGTSWQEYTFSYLQPVTTSSAMLSINVAQSTGTVWVDQVVLSGPGTVPAPTSSPAAPTATPVSPTASPVSSTMTPAPASTNTPSAPDTQPPTVNITNPPDGSQVQRRKTVTISADAQDNVGVTRVDFLVTASGYTWTCTDMTAAFSCAWKIPANTGVQYTLQATAYDQANNFTSQQVVVTAQ